jgi:predicted phage-related endonuclease
LSTTEAPTTPGRTTAPAALVLPGTAPEAEWQAARLKGVTASEIAVVMGCAPKDYGSAYRLYHVKRGTLPDSQPDTDAMALGRHMEPYVAGRFGERYPGLELEGTGRELYASRVRPWQMATPDRLAFPSVVTAEIICCDLHKPGDAPVYGAPAPCCDPDDCGPCCEDCTTCPAQNPPTLLATVECKIDGGSPDWGEDGTDEIPVHYRCQVLWQMDVLGVDAAYVACLMWQSRKVRVYEIGMDAAAVFDLGLLRKGAEDFLDRIEAGDPPPIDWRPATARALRELHPSVEDREVTIGRQLSISYRAAYRSFKAAERRKDEMTNRVLAEMGSARVAIEAGTGAKLAGRQVYDVKAHTRQASTVNKLVIAKESS